MVILDRAVGIVAEVKELSRFRAADVDIVVDELVGVDAALVEAVLRQLFSGGKRTLCADVAVAICEGSVCNIKGVISISGHGRYAVFLHDNFFMVADGADIVLGLRDLIDRGVVDLEVEDDIAGVLPDAIFYGIGMRDLLNSFRSHHFAAARAGEGLDAFGGAGRLGGNGAFVLGMAESVDSFLLGHGAAFVSAGVSNFAGFGAGSRGGIFIDHPFVIGIAVLGFGLKSFAADRASRGDGDLRSAVACLHRGLGHDFRMALSLDGLRDDGITIFAAIIAEAVLSAGSGDDLDECLGIEVVIFADFFDAGDIFLDLIDGGLEVIEGFGDTGDGSGSSLIGDFLGAEKSDDLIADILDGIDDGGDIGAEVDVTDFSDDGIDVGGDIGDFRLQVVEGGSEVIEVGGNDAI